MVTSVLTGMVQGVEGILIQVEADISQGLPMFNLFGSVSSEVKEGKERVRTAMKNSGIHLPPSRISVNLAPGDIRKSGTMFDLAIAVSLLLAMRLIPSDSAQGILFLGELSLDGSLSPVHGVLPIIRTARNEGYHLCFVPEENREEASLLYGMTSVGFKSLEEVYQHLKGSRREFKKAVIIDPETGECLPDSDDTAEKGILYFSRNDSAYGYHDFSEVKGQRLAKRALEIAAAGFHNVMMDGPPGVGKSMLASCLSGILPEMTIEEKLDTTMIYSVKGLLSKGFYLVENRPYRSPSQNVTLMGMFGGGQEPLPGEISLAHHGVLFLDEFPEYKKEVLEMLRVPLEEHKIGLIRNNRNIEFPADFILIAAANPCPCGYYPDRKRCRCSRRDILRYQQKISGPMRDRIDLFVRCEEVGYDVLMKKEELESSAVIRKRVAAAWERQKIRNGEIGEDSNGSFNGRLSSSQISTCCRLSPEGERLMASAYKHYHLSGRAYYRILKAARTIADLDGEENISTAHLEEALLYRNAAFSGD
ncbi:MAG: YifB family Mg chelatase-like AAA ATPase [Eubacterium sp.]|nr:YifB family Mg chelatase-like AAA ATPase [Eubacterium sp.]